MKNKMRNPRIIDLDQSDKKRKKIFNTVGISKLKSFPFNHKDLRIYYDSISSRIKEKSVSADLLKYKNQWKEIALIRDWKITKEGKLMESDFLKLRSQFNSGIRYMSFYSAKPGLILHKHRDLTGNLIQGFIRLHIPIYTHEECFYICGSKLNKNKLNAKVGSVYALDTGYLHGVVNFSEVNRIHLLIEIEVNEWLKKYLPGKTYNFFLHFLAFYFLWTPISIIKDPTLFLRIVRSKLKFPKLF